MKALVTKSMGKSYQLVTPEGKQLEARLRGKFRLKNIRHTNPIAVGDWVEYNLDENEDALIHEILERKNYIIRRSVNLSKSTHILAANLDWVFLLVTLDQPRTSMGFIDRFLVTAEAYHLPVALIYNKMDLAFNENVFEKYFYIYESLGLKQLKVSAITGNGLAELQKLLKDNVSLFAGHSGVGKSTLINSLIPDLTIKTAMVSNYNNKGQHTTTFAEMHPWPFGGYLIDSPGIKEFGLAEMEADEIKDYFPEMNALKNHCKFNNCLHISEPGCAVIASVENGEIHQERYQNYLNFYHEILEKQKQSPY